MEGWGSQWDFQYIVVFQSPQILASRDRVARIPAFSRARCRVNELLTKMGLYSGGVLPFFEEACWAQKSFATQVPRTIRGRCTLACKLSCWRADVYEGPLFVSWLCDGPVTNHQTLSFSVAVLTEKANNYVLQAQELNGFCRSRTW